MKLPLPPDFDLAWVLGFLAARTVPSMEAVADGDYRRSLRAGGRIVTLAIRPLNRKGGSALAVRSAPDLPAAEIRRLIVRMFDLEADLAGFLSLAAADPLLSRIVPRRPGIRLPQLLDPFEGMVRAIVGQQVSVAGAATTLDRLVRLLGEPAPPLDGHSFLAFPTPEAVAAARPEEIGIGAGLTRAKTKAIQGVATAVLDGRIDWDRLRAGTAEDSQAVLVALPGIGPWTASYVRMRTLGDRDAFPASDLGVIKALRVLTPQGEAITIPEITALGERWRPWRAYATLHLWNSLGG
ncbi:MAG TPA: DNA-3-methyladenine glycosylase [Thermoanaerobaculia bacterium]|nr:DNA-3-methyladenine glycosylase [Thermoanaerobaculia bacterium]